MIWDYGDLDPALFQIDVTENGELVNWIGERCMSFDDKELKIVCSTANVISFWKASDINLELGFESKYVIFLDILNNRGEIVETHKFGGLNLKSIILNESSVELEFCK